MHRLRQFSAALLLALVAAAAVLPLAASTATRRGCHCPVKMQCCEDGTCTMGGDESPATGPEWRTCRREAQSIATPLDVFERALRNSIGGKGRGTAARLAELHPTGARSTAPDPATPPPRSFSF
jgi:hypothetical protein